MRKRFLFLYSMGAVLLGCWLLFSTTIIIRLSGSTAPRKVSFDEINRTGKAVNYCFDASGTADDLTKDIVLAGWAFVETNGGNAQRYVSFIFAGEKRSYEFRVNEPEKRSDVKAAFPDKGIPDVYVGFTIDCATVGIEDGVYDLYVYCWENEEDCGIIDSGYQIVKTGDDVALSPWTAVQRETPIQITEEAASRFVIDEAALEGEQVKLRGWAFAEDIDCASQKVYISLTGEAGEEFQYPAKTSVREDVAEAYGNDLYTNSGFYTNIAAENIPDGVWDVQILVENGGQVWGTQRCSLTKHEGTVAIGDR